MVFSNACFSAAVNKGRALTPAEMNRQLAGIAEAFFERGVQNYIGAGWPVADDLAVRFATTFYEHALTGRAVGVMQGGSIKGDQGTAVPHAGRRARGRPGGHRAPRVDVGCLPPLRGCHRPIAAAWAPRAGARAGATPAARRGPAAAQDEPRSPGRRARRRVAARRSTRTRPRR